MSRACAALGAALTLMLVASPALAVEDRFHFGVDAGLATATYPEFIVPGFNAGAHGLYGISDAFNLRLSFDMSVYDLPDPASSALIWGGLAGAEYVLDTIDWVVYGGAQLGPVLVSTQNGDDVWQAGVEIPVGVSYLLSDRFALRLVEAKMRFQFFGTETSPTEQFMLGTGMEVMLEP